jgi:hypothetical protein
MNTKPRHGSFLIIDEIDEQTYNLFRSSKSLKENEMFSPTSLVNYDFLFRDLVQDKNNLLPETPEVIKALKELGAAMKEDIDSPSENTDIPTAYTYLGQFIDHDITSEATTRQIAETKFESNFFSPIPANDLRHKLKNARSGSLDLDSLYGGNAAVVNGLFKIGPVSQVGTIPPNKSIQNDLPRKPDTQKTAEIGDPRNDENLIIAQLHLAFLKFHNAIIKKKNVDFETAKSIVRQHYQWIVIHDFLMRICDTNVVNDILQNGNKWFKPTDDDFFMPVEFSAAAYRFGHSMVRSKYNFNLNFDGEKQATLQHLFQFTGLSGDLAGLPTLPQNWIIEWDFFLPFQTRRNDNARKIDTRLTFELQNLPQGPTPIFQFLAKLNLLRGYLLSLPTGQAAANLVLGSSKALTSDQILANANKEEKKALLNANLHEKTPLWYYILAEASIQNGGQKLGLLGSTIVAETLIGLIRKSEDSILSESSKTEDIDKDFTLEKLILFADLGPGQAEIQ